MSYHATGFHSIFFSVQLMDSFCSDCQLTIKRLWCDSSFIDLASSGFLWIDAVAWRRWGSVLYISLLIALCGFLLIPIEDARHGIAPLGRVLFITCKKHIYFNSLFPLSHLAHLWGERFVSLRVN
jgi:hypothetical protein